MIDPVPISKTGYSRLKEELERLEKTELPAVMQRVAEAREMGDLKENGEYISGREQQGFLVGRIRELKGMLSRSDIVDCTKVETDEAEFGTIVTLLDLDRNHQVTYQLLGPDEADSDNGSISVQSPIGSAILGHAVGDKVTVSIPRGDRHFEVIEIKGTNVP
ncbi:MAG: transcription elongation factor GreA [Solirubrobacterales bacterium]